MNKKQANTPSKRILWVDLEMTGLDPTKDPILEIAAIVTDWDFKELATYEGVVKIGARRLKKRIAANTFWETHTEARDGLLEQNKHGKSSAVIENELLKLIDKEFEKGLPVLLAGNSIHMDRQFIRKQWPRLDARLHYRMLDVSAWKVVFEAKYKLRFTKPEEHRALSDIRGSIDELKYYLARVKK